jgi:hypothetical protein
MATYNGSDKRLGYLFSNGGGGGSSTLDGLSDVNLTTPTDGQVLSYDANADEWVNSSSASPSSIASMSDTDIQSPTDGQALVYNSTSAKWENASGGGGSTHTYSTTEQVVGTWIDGKPIYEKTISFTNQTSSFSDFVTIEYISDVGTVISMDWTAYRISNDSYYTGNGGAVTESASYNTYRILFRFSKASAALQYFIGGYGTDISDISVIMRYTKSTD